MVVPSNQSSGWLLIGSGSLPASFREPASAARLIVIMLVILASFSFWIVFLVEVIVPELLIISIIIMI